MPSLPENGYYIRCTVFIISSGVGAFVAAEVKRKVKSSLNFGNEQRKQYSISGKAVIMLF